MGQTDIATTSPTPFTVARRGEGGTLSGDGSLLTNLSSQTDVAGILADISTIEGEISSLNAAILSSAAAHYVYAAPSGGGIPVWRQLATGDISGIGSAATCAAGTSAGDLLVLDENGYVPAANLPALTVLERYPVASQSAMLALSGAVAGDLAIRTDTSTVFVLVETPASTLGNWVELEASTAPVTSVNSLTGAVVISYSTLGQLDLGNSTYVKATGITAGFVPYWNGSKMVSSEISQSGGTLSLNGVVTIDGYGNTLFGTSFSVDVDDGLFTADSGAILSDGAGNLSTITITANSASIPTITTGLLMMGSTPYSALALRQSLPWGPGHYYCTNASASGNEAMAVTTRIAWQPIYIPPGTTVTRFGVCTGTSNPSTGNVRCAIYRDNGAGSPGTLVIDSGDISCPSSGNTFAYSSVNITLNDGWYWTGCQVNTTSVTFCSSGCSPLISGHFGTTTPNEQATTPYSSTTGYGAFPSTAPALTAEGGLNSGNRSPIIVFRVD